MPVEGLLSTLEGAFSALIKESPLTSFKIDGRGDGVVVVLSFSTGQLNYTVMWQYQPKPWLQLARDRRQADIRKRKVNSDSLLMPFFMPTPPGQLTEKSQEASPMMSDLTGLHQRDNTFHNYTACESCSAPTEVTLDSELT